MYTVSVDSKITIVRVWAMQFTWWPIRLTGWSVVKRQRTEIRR